MKLVYSFQIPYPPYLVQIKPVDIGAVLDFVAGRISEDEYIRKIEGALVENKVPSDKTKDVALYIADVYRKKLSEKITRDVHVFRVPYVTVPVVLTGTGIKAIVDYLQERISFRTYYEIIRRQLIRSGVPRGQLTSTAIYLTELYRRGMYVKTKVSGWVNLVPVWFIRMKYDKKLERYVLIESEVKFEANMPYICWVENRSQFLKDWDNILTKEFRNALESAGFLDISQFEVVFKDFITAYEILDIRPGREEIYAKLLDFYISISHNPADESTRPEPAALPMNEEATEAGYPHIEDAVLGIEENIVEVCRKYVVRTKVRL